MKYKLQLSHLNVLTFPPLTGGCSEGLDAFRFLLKKNYFGIYIKNVFVSFFSVWCSCMVINIKCKHTAQRTVVFSPVL